MSQKTISEQLAEMQNNLIALDKIINAPVQAVEKKVKSFLIVYDDGTEQVFVPEVAKPKLTTAEILLQLRDRSAKREEKYETAADPLFPKQRLREGFACVINGTRYNSIVHASRVLGVCRHSIKARLDNGTAGYEYV